MKYLALALLLVCSYSLFAQKDTAPMATRNWSIHGQVTSIPQYHFPFKANYSGQNSLKTSEPAQVSFTSTIYLGRRLWKNAVIYFNPEASGGSGLSSALGVAGFPNGETFRIGSKQIKLYLARLYLEQKFALGKDQDKDVDDQNSMQGSIPAKYISIRVGKFSLADFFDDNAYSHDPRTQFLNWSLMSNGAWDYPANTRGYTVGIITEYHSPQFSVRISAAQMPINANGPDLDGHILQSHGLTAELDKTIHINKRPGAIRLLLYHNLARMGSYRDAINADPGNPDITSVRSYSKSKNGVTLSFEQEISKSAGVFFRTGFNDGNNETWVFTEIDRTVSGGIVFNGNSWKRKNDQLGLAFSINGLSSPHRDYLKAGGYGFIIGDGNLNYSPETIFETFYSFKIPKIWLTLSPDYQFILNPAYNKDRGPVHVIGIRAHFEI